MSLLGSLFHGSKSTNTGGDRGADVGAKARGDSAELLAGRASALASDGRFAEAHDYFLRAEAGGVRTGTLYRDLAWSAFSTGRIEQAEVWMRKAVDAEPDAWEARFKLAVILQAQNKLAEAASCFRSTLEFRSDHFESLLGLAECALASGDLDAAETHIRRAVSRDAERAASWDCLGVTMVRQGRHPEALEAFGRAVRLESSDDELDCFVNLAIELTDAGRPAEAIELCERMLPTRPSVNGHFCYALALLAGGRWCDGWRQYEFRFLRSAALSRRAKSSRPMWSGQDLKGKTVLLRSEQGFGDTIQFLRYAPQLNALGAKVLFEAFAGFEDLARRFPGIDLVVPEGPMPNYDFHSYLMSLPRVFGTDPESIPSCVPYLDADPARTEFWSTILGDDRRLKVGLVWSGNLNTPLRYRSISLQSLVPLWDVQGARFVSLQKGAEESEFGVLPQDKRLLNLGAQLTDFSDTAALVSQMDVIISVDTSVAHLAGVLGKQTWTMIPKPAGWRWTEDREDSPWYPTMRLFRQRQRGEWGDVVERLKVALLQRVAENTEVRDSQKSQSGNPEFLSTMQARVAAPIAAASPALSAVAETRYGIVQYFPSDLRLGASLEWYGEYLQSQLDLLAKMVRPGASIVEVGADVGAGALFLAAAVGPGGHLFLYESRPVIQRVLRQNLVANSVTNVTVMKQAIRLSQVHAPSGAVPVRTESAQLGSIVEPSETVDELQLKRLDWIKISDSTAALAIVAGAAHTIWRLRPSLFIAAADESGLASLCDRLREFGYRCFRVAAPIFNPTNFNRRDTDIFAGEMALALLAIPEEVEIDIALEGSREIS